MCFLGKWKVKEPGRTLPTCHDSLVPPEALHACQHLPIDSVSAAGPADKDVSTAGQDTVPRAALGLGNGMCA